MNNWNDYQLILALARNKSLRAAALEMKVNHATLSRRLDVLNQHFDALVFERTAKGYLLTRLGKTLFDAAEKIEEVNRAATRARSAMGSEYAGKITLSIPPTIGQFLLKDSLFEFSRHYPQIELIVHNTFVIEDLDKLEADIVVRGHNRPQQHLVGRRLIRYSLCFYGNRDYLQNTPREALKWIGKPDDSMFPDWTQDTDFRDVPVGIRIDDVLGRHQAAVAGHGLTRGACYMADQEPSLVRLPNVDPVPFQQLWILMHPDSRNTPRIKLLMDYLAEHIIQQRNLIEGNL